MPTLASLASVNAALLNVRDVAANAAKNFAAARSARADAQTRLNVAQTAASRIAAAHGPRDVRTSTADASLPPFNVINVHAGVPKYWVHQPNVLPGQTLDANVQITRSAQVGALLLSFGGRVIDLNSAATASASELFRIEIQGRFGSQQLAFTSGTSIANVRDAINTFTSGTGVHAVVVGQSGIRLQSTRFGADEFVRVRIIHPANINGGGVYQYSSSNNAVPNTGSAVTFVNALNAVTDHGQNVAATINGAVAVGQGLELTPIVTSGFLGTIRLTQQRAQSLGSFLAFQIVGLTDNAPRPAGDQGLPADQPRLYTNSGVVSPRITSKSVDLRG